MMLNCLKKLAINHFVVQWGMMVLFRPIMLSLGLVVNYAPSQNGIPTTYVHTEYAPTTTPTHTAFATIPLSSAHMHTNTNVGTY